MKPTLKAANEAQVTQNSKYGVLSSSPQSQSSLYYPTVSVSPEPPAEPRTWSGQLCILFAFDLANEIEVEKITEISGHEAKLFRFDGSRRSPHYLFFYSLPCAKLEPITVDLAQDVFTFEVSTKVLPVGAISLRMVLHFEGFTLGNVNDLVNRIEEGGGLRSRAVELAFQIQQSLRPFCIGPTRTIQPDEPYIVACLYRPQTIDSFDALSWVAAHSREIAAFLADEEPEQLSESEIRERLSRTLQFYRSDVAIIDWERSFLIDTPEGMEEILYVLELANVQWVELETYDRLLDNALENAYMLISEKQISHRAARLMTRLREIRIDLAKLRDELSNITRFLGDWYLGRVYSAAASRMQFTLWQNTIQEKLKTVNELYEMVRHERTERWMLMLESSIVALFILDLLAYLLLH